MQTLGGMQAIYAVFDAAHEATRTALDDEDDKKDHKRGGGNRRTQPNKVQRIKDAMDAYIQIRGQVTLIIRGRRTCAPKRERRRAKGTSATPKTQTVPGGTN